MGQNNGLSLVACLNHRLTQYRRRPLQSGLLCRQYAVIFLPFSAFVARSKLAKYELLRGEVDLHKHMKKGLRRAIASADQAIRDRSGLYPSLPLSREAVEAIPPT